MINNENLSKSYISDITVYKINNSDDWNNMKKDIIHKDSGYSFFGNKVEDIFDRLDCLFNVHKYLEIDNNKYTVAYNELDEFIRRYLRKFFPKEKLIELISNT